MHLCMPAGDPCVRYGMQATNYMNGSVFAGVSHCTVALCDAHPNELEWRFEDSRLTETSASAGALQGMLARTNCNVFLQQRSSLKNRFVFAGLSRCAGALQGMLARTKRDVSLLQQSSLRSCFVLAGLSHCAGALQGKACI
eukprot:1161491-Pelagomonas_calceolata.AAC.8